MRSGHLTKNRDSFLVFFSQLSQIRLDTDEIFDRELLLYHARCIGLLVPIQMKLLYDA